MINMIKNARFGLLGLFKRKEEGTVVKKIYKGSWSGRRPRKAWLEDVEEDLGEIRIRVWRR